jgi:bifunctional DNA-binding transcriptional regulator/antitoxin component of YhaV-PrlF toxin-antitoxin module
MVDITLDKAGRVVFPKKFREKFDTNVFEVIEKNNGLLLKPKATLLSWAGKVPDIDVKGWHKERKKEIAREPIA